MFETNSLVSPNTIDVFENYEIKTYYERILNREKKEYYKEPIEVIENTTNKVKRTYNPFLETPELLTELLKINLNNKQDFLKFISNYGSPVNVEFNENSLDFYGIDPNSYHWSSKRIRLDHLKYPIEYLKKLSSVWKAIGDNNESELETVNKKFKEVDLESFQKGWHEVKHKDTRTITKKAISLFINQENLGTYSLNLSGTKIVPMIKFEELINIAWWQLANAIVQENHFKECELCGHWFLPQHGHQRFCPPKIGRKHSTCHSTYNQRKKRERKKDKVKAQTLFKEGYNPIQIANKLNRETTDIKKWLEL